MAITGRPISAEEALHWGLVTKVADDGEGEGVCGNSRS